MVKHYEEPVTAGRKRTFELSEEFEQRLNKFGWKPVDIANAITSVTRATFYRNIRGETPMQLKAAIEMLEILKIPMEGVALGILIDINNKNVEFEKENPKPKKSKSKRS